MATHDGGSPTLGDFDLDATVFASDHTPSLRPSERFVRCTSCGLSVPYSITAEVPIRRALRELDGLPCDRYELPDVSVGDHVPTIDAGGSSGRREVRCESCGRSASFETDGERVLRELGRIPCIAELSHVELVDMLVSPTSFTPPLSELGITNWTGRPGDHHGSGTARFFRHDRFQYTVYLCRNDDDTYTARLTAGPDATSDPLAELHVSTGEPSDPVTRNASVTLVTFLGATDPLSSREFRGLHRVYEDAYASHRELWLEDAYRKARVRFEERHGESPDAFVDAFAESVEDAEEALRRMVGSGGFEDPGPDAFAAETLGHGLEFPGFFSFVADCHEWTPPVPDA